MIKENNPLLTLKFTKKNSIFYEIYNYLSESIYDLFELILDDPIESFWFECFIIFIGYLQMFAYLLDSTVRIK